MRRWLLVALALAACEPAPDRGERRRARQAEARWVDLHRVDPPNEAGSPSPRLKLALKRFFNWPGNLGEQYDVSDGDSARGQTRSERTLRVTPPDATR